MAWGDAVIVNSQNYSKNKTHPIGTGPFQFEKWVRGNRVEPKCNTKYWAKKPALPEGSTFPFCIQIFFIVIEDNKNMKTGITECF